MSKKLKNKEIKMDKLVLQVIKLYLEKLDKLTEKERLVIIDTLKILNMPICKIDSKIKIKDLIPRLKLKNK